MAVPRGDVGIAPADHLVLIVEPDRLALRVDPPWCRVENLAEDRRIVVPQHEVERPPIGPKALVSEGEPARQTLAHKVEEELVQCPVGLASLELARLGAIRVVAVILDELLERDQLRSVLDVVLRPDERARPSAAGLVDDRLDGLAGDVSAQDEDVRLVDRPGVDELAEAFAGAMQVADKIELRPGHLTPPRRSGGPGWPHP